MMELLSLHYEVSGTDFTCAGEASGKIKKNLKELGFPTNIVRNVAIAVYEGEINMVIHGGGGVIDVEISPDCISIVLADQGPGIPDVSLAMQEGYSTAPDNVRQLGFGAGMGLPNIKKYTDEMIIETEVGKGTTIKLKVFVN
ncbi:MAG: ATP-binding protein [Clostridia bacterium]|nr:ATP-binding protein [Clostridia bacterium]MBQ6837933.1 ATP-binding protein [Clostridia bacterium]